MYGTFVRLNDAAGIEVLAGAGLDFVILDNEHTAMSKESMVSLIRAADISGLTVSVRVRGNDVTQILQALDSGAMGVQIPQIDSFPQAKAVVDAVKYAPVGKRGFAASQRSAGYGMMNPVEYARLSNEETMIASYCETAAGIENLGEILTIPQIDIIFIGPFDLSQALGVLGEPNHPTVLSAIEDIAKKTRAAGKAVGIIASSAEQTRRWHEMGIQYITYSSDLGMMASDTKRYLKEMRE